MFDQFNLRPRWIHMPDQINVRPAYTISHLALLSLVSGVSLSTKYTWGLRQYSTFFHSALDNWTNHRYTWITASQMHRWWTLSSGNVNFHDHGSRMFVNECVDLVDGARQVAIYARI